MILVSHETLRRYESAIRDATAIELEGRAGEYLRYHTLFASGLASRVGLGDIDEALAFYNAYYWFERFVRARIAEHGPDAGLEQQAFQLLEHAPIELDPDVMTALTERIERDSRG